MKTDTRIIERPGADSQTEIADKIAYARRWGFSRRMVDCWLASGMPHLKIGKRRIRIVVPEADAWLRERYGAHLRR